jgi:hypothetical protein
VKVREIRSSGFSKMRYYISALAMGEKGDKMRISFIKVRYRFPILAALSFVAWGVASAQTTREVDCDQDSLKSALSASGSGDTLRIAGTCRDPITINIDRFTLDGQGTAVFDGGFPGGCPAGCGGETAAIVIDGARGVIVRGFTIRNNIAGGILGLKNASFSVQNTKVESNYFGVGVQDSSHAEFVDCEITDNRNGGVGILDTSAVEFKGSVRVNRNLDGIGGSGRCNIMFSGGLLEASGNRNNGIFLSGCSIGPSNFLGGHRVVVNDNGADGLFIGGGQLVIGPYTTFGYAGPIFQEIVAQRNKGNGVNLAGFASIVNLGAGKFDLQDNAVGLNLGIESSLLSIGGIHAASNGTGILADGAGTVTLGPNPPNTSLVQGNRDADVDLRFGTRVTVVGATIGTPLKCDGTVLSSGSIKCDAVRR